MISLLVETLIPAASPADVAPMETDVHCPDMSIAFFQDLTAPWKGTPGQHLHDDPFATTTFSPTSQTAPFNTFTATSLDETF
ncbi:hypothetical protein Hanom_Chr09g00785441 [Helianthus anomalus]